MLPIDPAAIDAEDVGEKRAVVALPNEEAIEYVREAFESAGFGIPVEFSPSELLTEKIDADRDPYYVLGACNPEMADRALEISEDIGGLFPCNVIVRQLEPGRQEVFHVSIMRVARLVGLAPDSAEWDAIVEDTGAYVEAAYDNL